MWISAVRENSLRKRRVRDTGSREAKPQAFAGQQSAEYPDHTAARGLSTPEEGSSQKYYCGLDRLVHHSELENLEDILKVWNTWAQMKAMCPVVSNW